MSQIQHEFDRYSGKPALRSFLSLHSGKCLHRWLEIVRVQLFRLATARNEKELSIDYNKETNSTTCPPNMRIDKLEFLRVELEKLKAPSFR